MSIRGFLIALVVFLPTFGFAQSRGQAAETLPGATNYTRVEPTVACGGATGVEAFPVLKERGFKAVINLRQDSEPEAHVTESRLAAEAAGLRYVHIPFNGHAPTPEPIDAFLVAVADPSNSPVYIHCTSANRVGAMWLAKRVLVDGWDVERATKEAELIGLKTPELKQFVLEYIETHRH